MAGAFSDGKSQEETFFVALLKDCAKEKNLSRGSNIHSAILRRGLLKKNVFLGSSLVNMYAKCGALAKARRVFDKLRVRNVVTWNALISGYTQHGHDNEAVACFEKMKHKGLSPNAVTFSCMLKTYASLRAADKGQELHNEILRRGLLEKNAVLGTALLDMYAKSGALDKAQQVFDKLPLRDIVSWTSLITGYCQHGHSEEALSNFEQMKSEGFSPNSVTFTALLKAFGSMRAVEKGKEIHIEIERKGLLKKDNVLGNALIDMYAKCGSLGKAQEVFDDLLVRDVVSWNVLIAGYCLQGRDEEALACFEQMQHEGLSPDPITLSCILKACGGIGAAGKGKEIHLRIIREGFSGKDNVLENALLDMYTKCGAFEMAKQVFNELSLRDKFSWTLLIAGYCQHGFAEEAVRCFEQMKNEGLSLDGVTLLCIVQAYGSLRAVEKGKELHAGIVREGLLKKDSVLGTALVDMYAKCGVLALAQAVFDELLVQDLITWTALIAGYSKHGLGEEVLNFFGRMQSAGLSPNAVTFACLLSACGSIGATEKGIEIHAEITRKGLLGTNCVLGNALVDMYVKCGALTRAQQVFDDLFSCDVISWNVLIAGYIQCGKYDVVFHSFDKMIGQGIEPNQVTFLLLLTVCSQLSLINEGEQYFEAMSASYGIVPALEHRICMVDLYVNAGMFTKALSMIEKIPPSDCFPAWFTLLVGCQKWQNVLLGRLAFEHAVQLDGNSSMIYVCMRKIYATAGMQKEADKIEAMRLENEEWKGGGLIVLKSHDQTVYRIKSSYPAKTDTTQN